MSFHSELSSRMRAQLLNLSTKRLSRNTQILRTAYNHFFFLHISRDRHTFKVKTCQKYQSEATLKATEVKKLLSQDTGHLSFHALHPLYLTFFNFLQVILSRRMCWSKLFTLLRIDPDASRTEVVS